MLTPAAQNALAIASLVLLALGFVLWIVVAIRRMPLTPVQSVLWGWNYLMARVLWRAKIQGEIDAPPGRGVVVVCNHRGPIDPSFIALATKRVVHWMVAREFWWPAPIAWLLQVTGSIPVGRGGIDTAATRMAIRLGGEGEVVGLFPEGRINTTEKLLLPGRLGAAMIALMARVPVIPCYVEGSPAPRTTLGFLVMPAKARLRIGEPIDLSAYYDRADDREVQKELTKRFLKEIAKLAGQPDFEPQLAGRFQRQDGDKAEG